MKYISTRGGIAPIGFQEAVLMGLARDGGLLLPAEIPDVSSRLSAWRALPYLELAHEIISLYADVPHDELADRIHRSYSTFRHAEVTPLVAVGDLHILELFHGPTLAFKDVALQLLGNLFEYFLQQAGSELNVLGATSGDTGSAAIHGLRGRDHMRVFILYPDGRTSRIQELQMTTVPDANIHALAVEGTFDDCQRIVKDIFGDLAFKDRFQLGAVNSINWARLLAQVVYYFYAAFRAMEKTGAGKVSFTVPTGNFGNIFAGYLAARMGLPVGRLVLATNENDILARFFKTGEYALGGVQATLSPSMDIQVASNFERYLYYRMGEDPECLRAWMKEFAVSGCAYCDPGEDELFESASCNTSDTLRTIRRYHEKQGYVLDPHSAVGVCVGERHLVPDEPMICLATAHPAKFAPAIEKALGENPANHPIVDGLHDLPSRREVLPASESAVRDYVRSHVGG